MTPKIIEISEKKMLGMRLEMSLIDNKTGDLFRSFMPHKRKITNTISNGVYALQQYDFKNFTSQTLFDKWACVEVSDFDFIPSQMETLIVKSGKYVKFVHKGTTSDFVKTFRYMLETWIPQNGHETDFDRPHFEYLGERYLGPNDSNSEEEVWIPIK